MHNRVTLSGLIPGLFPPTSFSFTKDGEISDHRDPRINASNLRVNGSLGQVRGGKSYVFKLRMLHVLL